MSVCLSASAMVKDNFRRTGRILMKIRVHVLLINFENEFVDGQNPNFRLFPVRSQRSKSRFL